jgi:predicted SAM-dependent methyltransferase
MKLNLACGLCKLDGYINVDVNPEMNPDVVMDVAGVLPWKDDEVDEILFFHAIEHIESKYHFLILEEFWRILTPNGRLILGYPEFSVCIKYWLDNYMGRREFWGNCIYGRQSDPKDFHVSPMHTPELVDLMKNTGFKDITTSEEAGNPQYTILKALKGEKRMTYEESVGKLIFGDVKPLGVGVGDQNVMRGN